MPKLPVLDGWRGISILAVMLCHLGPYNSLPEAFLESALGVFGMALFFCLSGFLITSSLYFNPNVRVFLIRRFFRIVPAVWLFLLITMPFASTHLTRAFWLANLFFYINHWPFQMVGLNSHFWSLSVEVQFYVGIAIAFAVLRRRAFWLLPILCLVVTYGRIHMHETNNIETRYRVDEILSGALLAYVFHSPWAGGARKVLAHLPPPLLFALLLASSSIGHRLAPLEYMRPYVAALLVGSTLCQPDGLSARILKNHMLAYLATISYALYLWHPIMGIGWRLGTPTVFNYFCSPPLGIASLFAVAHFSTFYFEKRCIQTGKWLSAKLVPHAG